MRDNEYVFAFYWQKRSKKAVLKLQEQKREDDSRVIDEGVVETVIERLRRAGLVNDEGFAQFWVENRTAFRPKGKRALQADILGFRPLEIPTVAHLAHKAEPLRPAGEAANKRGGTFVLPALHLHSCVS